MASSDIRVIQHIYYSSLSVITMAEAENAKKGKRVQQHKQHEISVVIVNRASELSSLGGNIHLSIFFISILFIFYSNITCNRTIPQSSLMSDGCRCTGYECRMGTVHTIQQVKFEFFSESVENIYAEFRERRKMLFEILSKYTQEGH